MTDFTDVSAASRPYRFCGLEVCRSDDHLLRIHHRRLRHRRTVRSPPRPRARLGARAHEGERRRHEYAVGAGRDRGADRGGRFGGEAPAGHDRGGRGAGGRGGGAGADDEAAARIEDLVRLGVPFDTSEGEIALAREGAHSQARVLHAGGDSTGAHIELTLASLARQEGITVLEHTIATEIVAVGDAGPARLRVPRTAGTQTRHRASGAEYKDRRDQRIQLPAPHSRDGWRRADVSRVDEPGGGDG